MLPLRLSVIYPSFLSVCAILSSLPAAQQRVGRGLKRGDPSLFSGHAHGVFGKTVKEKAIQGLTGNKKCVKIPL